MTEQKERKCCDNQERICDGNCISFAKDGFSIQRVPKFDRTLPTPQWTWAGTEAWRAIVCKKHGFTIELLEKTNPPEEKRHDRT